MLIQRIVGAVDPAKVHLVRNPGLGGHQISVSKYLCLLAQPTWQRTATPTQHVGQAGKLAAPRAAETIRHQTCDLIRHVANVVNILGRPAHVRSIDRMALRFQTV